MSFPFVKTEVECEIKVYAYFPNASEIILDGVLYLHNSFYANNMVCFKNIIKKHTSSLYKLRYLSCDYGKFDHLITWVEKNTLWGEKGDVKKT